MNLSVRSHFILMLISTAIAWACWFAVVTSVHPSDAGVWGFSLFYGTLFLSVFGTVAFIGFTLRTVLLSRRSTVRYRMTLSLRQGFLLASALSIALALQGSRLLSWWVLALLIIIFALVELFIESSEQERHVR